MGVLTQMMTRRAILGAAAGMLAGCRKPSEIKDPIRISVNRRPGMAGVYQAVESGYFAAAGVPVELVTMGTGMETVPVLAQGGVDVSFFPSNAAVFNAVAKGARIRLVAGREIAREGCSDFGAIYGRGEAFPGGLKDLRELQGKRVATNGRLNVNHFALDVLLESVGMTVADVSVTHLQPPDAITALRSGQIDALVGMHLYGPTLQQRFPDWVRHPGLPHHLPDFQYGYVFFGKRLLEGPVDVGGRVLAAYLKGVRDFLGGKTPKFLDDLARSSGMDPMEARGYCREIAVEDGAIREESLRFYSAWAVKRGHCERTVGIDELVDRRYLQHAREQVG